MDLKCLPAHKYELHYLSHCGLIDQIRKLACIRKHVNEKDVQGRTPLHLACEQNHTQVIKFLVKLGADVNSRDKNLSTPLHWAVYNNNTRIVKRLLMKKVDVQAQDSNGIQPIHLAALKGNGVIINLFIISEYILKKTKCDDIIDKQGITPLHLAALCGHNDALRVLLHIKNFDVNISDKNGIQPLHLAVGNNHIKCVKLLQAKGAMVSYSDSNNSYPIHWAAVNGNVQVIKTLNLASEPLKQDCLDKFKCTPLFLATIFGHDEAVNFLLQNYYTLNLESGQREMYLILTNLEGPDGVINKYFNQLASLPGTLHWAAAFCSKNIVERLLDNGANIEKTIDGTTPLHAAASFGNIDVVKLLIDRGAQLNPLDKDESTPLHWAVAHCHTDIIQLLLDKGANKNYALSWAATCGNLEIVKLLIDNGCDVTESDEDPSYAHTPLLWAAICGHVEIIEYLLDNGADIKTKDVLHWCTVNGLVDTVKMLIERGVDVNDLDLCFSRTALHCAAIVGNVDITEYLLSVDGIDVNAMEDNCDLPIHYAVQRNHCDIIKMLIDHGAYVNEIGGEGVPVQMAAEDGNLQTLKILVEGGANINTSFYGPPLPLAAEHGHMDIVDYLLEKGAKKGMFVHNLAQHCSTTVFLKYMTLEEVNDLTEDKQTPLFYAIRGDFNNVKFLIENGADVNHKDIMNRTPLFEAISSENFDCVKILIDNGADVNMKMCDGMTPLMLAIKIASLYILILLVDKYNADIKILDDNLRSPLHYAVQIGDNIKKLRIIQYLLSKNFDVNIIDCERITPLYLAIITVDPLFDFLDDCHQEIALEIVKLLLNNGADANVKSIHGHTPLSIAVQQKDTEYVKLLILHGADVNLDTDIKTYCTSKFDMRILKLLHCAGLHFNNIPQSDLDEFDSEVRSYITYTETNPLNLKQLCRISCLNTFGKDYLRTVKCQLLPDVVKQFLLFDQL